MQKQPLCGALSGKVQEQAELIAGLIERLPDGQPDWRPPAGNSWNTGRLLGHLLDCLAGMCAVLHAAHPDALRHFLRLRELPVNHCCGRDEALARIPQYRTSLTEGFALLTDEDLARSIPTVFVPGGEPLLSLILGNLEHITNHKHELFTHLKLMGVAVGTPDLYRFRA
jgi:DinB superfamily